MAFRGKENKGIYFQGKIDQDERLHQPEQGVMEEKRGKPFKIHTLALPSILKYPIHNGIRWIKAGPGISRHNKREKFDMAGWHEACFTIRAVKAMPERKKRETRIVVMSPGLMKIYEVQGLGDGFDYQPITFRDPRECLEMLVKDESPEILFEEEDPAASLEKIEKQWGELELRLSFFTDSFTWQ